MEGKEEGDRKERKGKRRDMEWKGSWRRALRRT